MQSKPDWQVAKDFIIANHGVFAPSKRFPDRWSWQLYAGKAGGLELICDPDHAHYSFIADYRLYAISTPGDRCFPLLKRWCAYVGQFDSVSA